MKKIYDKSRVREALSGNEYQDLLESLEAELFLIEYEPGELISAPWLEDSLFQIVLFGELSIYFIRNDGTKYSLASGQSGYILGDMDLFLIKNSNIYARVTKRLTSIAFIMKHHKETLYQNSRFLYLVGRSMAQKMAAMTALDAAPSSLQERVLSYMEFQCESGKLKGIEKNAFRLHCSARQLQRILNAYEKDGLVVKTGKGSYQLVHSAGREELGFTPPHSDKYPPADETRPQ